MSKIALIAGILVAAVVVAAVGYYVMTAESNPENELATTVNGSEYTYAEMIDEFGSKTVDGKEGVPLDALVTGSGLASPETYTYILAAGDGYAMAVNWTMMQSGIVTMEEEVDEDTGNETTYLMTVFPGLPSGYKVKNLADINHAQLTPIVCNGLEYYLDYMPRRVEEKKVTYNGTYAPTGWSLSDMVNYTGLEAPEDHEYTICGYDATDEEPWYNRTVSWDGMMGGVIVEEDVRSVFAESTDYARNSYRIRNVVEIIVED